MSRVNGNLNETTIENLNSNTLYGFKIVTVGENDKIGRPVAINTRTFKK